MPVALAQSHPEFGDLKSPNCRTEAAHQAERYFTLSTNAWSCVDDPDHEHAVGIMHHAIDLARHAVTYEIRHQARRLVRDFYLAYWRILEPDDQKSWANQCSLMGIVGGWITNCQPNDQDDTTAMFLGQVPVLATPEAIDDGGNVA